MEPQITSEKIKWHVVETVEGITYLPKDEFRPEDCYDPDKILRTYMIEGYGARLDMGGSLDKTNWTVHNTPEDALNYLEKMHCSGSNKELKSKINTLRDKM